MQAVPFWIRLEFDAFNMTYDDAEQKKVQEKYLIKRVIRLHTQ